ncbi:uncharacterized protein FIBRA_01235 [Fibroporia radiculosa]|uniref:tripeptidyl-peptidase II n=1 Tax=Fibroporia radiculosa TaxID=599839 RepID=J4GJM9_9APHY|nr:uncharacterized protein FIBRA_01235 [Fibroporia radiculosa]CCL99220.1 predicted protein [Fibroporia radiculosa]
MLPTSLVFAAVSGLVLGSPFSRSLQVHESRSSIPSGYSLSGPAPANSVLKLRIALVQNDLDGLVNVLQEVSDPTNANYGNHLSKSEVETYVSPTSDSVSAVNTWLSENGLTPSVLSPAGDWLGVEVTVNQANSLFGADYSIFEHSVTGLQTVRTLSYSVPNDLAEYINLVHPTISFPNPYGNAPNLFASKSRRSTPSAERRSSAETAASPCGTGTPGITPACLQYLYGIPSAPATSPYSSLAVTEYEYEWASYADLETFLQDYRPDMNPSTTFTVQSVDNGTDSQSPGDAGLEALMREQNLDIQYTVGLATDIPVTMVTVGGDDFLQSLLDTALFLLNEPNPPQVVSTSYGDDEYLVSEKMANTICNTYAQLGARGVSLIFSSGDGGVSGNHFSECTTFIPTFPSTCPYITTVGATTIVDDETAVDFSGGGFSNYFPRPYYQDGAVAEYLIFLGDNNTGLYNASGRGYPDVAAYGVNFDIVIDTYTAEVSGTSCSAPTFASIIALLNDQLLAAHRPVLGFLNPLLYASGNEAFKDITTGNNRACTNNTGFDATIGWDPVTGLGTPKFSGLQLANGL